MPKVSRRNFLTATTSALGTLATATPAEATKTPQGSIQGGKVENGQIMFPPIEAETESVENHILGPDPYKTQMGVAVVGLGRVALQHILPGLRQTRYAHISALVSGDSEKLKIVAAQYGVPATSCYSYEEFDRIANNNLIDIVYIALPNAMHCDYTIRAAKAGKHIICEKPLATTVVDAQKMVDVCKQNKVSLMVAYRCQYDPAWQQLARLLRQQGIGHLSTMMASNTQTLSHNAQWRLQKKMAGGGSLIDLGLYCINAFRFFTGEEPVRVSARVFSPPKDGRFIEVEDNASFTLTFPSGIMATAQTSYSAHKNSFFRIGGDKAWAGMDPFSSYSDIQLEMSHMQAGSIVDTSYRFADHDQFAMQIDQFVLALRHHAAPYTPGEEGVMDMRVIEALYQSIEKEGREVVLSSLQGKSTWRGPWLGK